MLGRAFTKIAGSSTTKAIGHAIIDDPKRALRVAGQLASMAKFIPHPVAQLVSRAGMAATAMSAALPNKHAPQQTASLRPATA